MVCTHCAYVVIARTNAREQSFMHPVPFFADQIRREQDLGTPEALRSDLHEQSPRLKILGSGYLSVTFLIVILVAKSYCKYDWLE